MLKNTASQKVTLVAYDSATGKKKTGDAGNITFYYNGDDGGVTVFSTSSGHPAEDDATNSPGTYTLAVTQGETNYNKIMFSGKSGTSGIEIVPLLVYPYPTGGIASPTNITAATGITVSTNSDKTGYSVTGLTASDVGAIKTKTDFLPSATAGAAGGLFIAGTNAATTITTALTTTFTGNLTGSVASVSGAVGSVTGAVASVTGNVGGNVTGSVGSVVGAVGSVTGSVGSVVGAVGSVTGAVGSVTGAVGSVTGAVGSVTGNVGGNVVGSVASVTGLTTATIATAVLTTAVTEAYAADGAAPTVAQALCLLIALNSEFSISSTTLTAKKLDGSTTAATFTLNDATTPTAITRAT